MYNIVYLNNLQLATQVSFLGNFADSGVWEHMPEFYQIDTYYYDKMIYWESLG
jgi:hypothetical protein